MFPADAIEYITSITECRNQEKDMRMIQERNERWGWLHAQIREMLVDDVKVSWLTILDYTMRIGGALVRMGGIAGVNTDRNHRYKGYSRQVITDSIAAMNREGYDVSMLFGIPDFYDKFGYAVCLANHTLTLSTRDAERAQPLLKTRVWKPADDLTVIRRIYNATNESRSCSLVRPENWNGWMRGSDWGYEKESIVAVDAQDRVVGYVALDVSTTQVRAFEIGASPRSHNTEVYESLLRALANLAIERRCAEIEVFLPNDHSFSIFARRFGCAFRSTYPRNAEGMGRIVNVSRLFEKLLPEFNRRLVLTNNKDLTAAIDFVTDIGTVKLRIEEGKATLAAKSPTRNQLHIPQSVLFQLVTGYRNIDDIRNDEGVKANSNVVSLLQILMPMRCPYIWRGDHF